jgi:hypothetical protein
MGPARPDAVRSLDLFRNLEATLPALTRSLSTAPPLAILSREVVVAEPRPSGVWNAKVTTAGSGCTARKYH